MTTTPSRSTTCSEILGEEQACAIKQPVLLTCVLYKRPVVEASQVLYEIATEGWLLLAHDKMLSGEGEAALQGARESSAPGNVSQNSANAVLLLRQRLKGWGLSGVAGGSRENSGKVIKDEPCCSGSGIKQQT